MFVNYHVVSGVEPGSSARAKGHFIIESSLHPMTLFYFKYVGVLQYRLILYKGSLDDGS